MTTMKPSNQELISAFADGELDISAKPVDFQSDTLLGDWNAYLLIGDVMRASPLNVAGDLLGANPDFLQRLNLSLVNEEIAPAQQQPVFAATRGEAANDGTFRWKVVAGFASVATAAVFAWSFGAAPDSLRGAELAAGSAPQQILVTSPQGPVVRDAQLEELLAAHKQLSGSSLQAPSGFLRHAGFESQQSGAR